MNNDFNMHQCVQSNSLKMAKKRIYLYKYKYINIKYMPVWNVYIRCELYVRSRYTLIGTAIVVPIKRNVSDS